MQQNTKSNPLPTRSYAERALAEMERRALEAETKLAAVKSWVATEAWRESGTDDLHKILEEK